MSKGTAFQSKSTIATVKFEGGNIMVCFSVYGTGMLYIFKGRMKKCPETFLNKNRLPSTRMMTTKRGWTFQQDNDSKHSAKESQLVSEKEN